MKITPYSVVIGTLWLVIIVLLLRNVDAFSAIVQTVTDIAGKSFKAVTEVGDFGEK